MTATMYSTEEVAEALGLHVRTVRGYVRDGSLPAVRIGKQYRIARADFEQFAGGRTLEAAVDDAPRVEVSAIVAVEGVAPQAMSRITTHLMAAVSSRTGAGHLDVHTVYDQARQTLRIIVVGDPDDAARAITLSSALAAADRR
ncbi:helix-turn-helix domain-containing protein [Mycobacterium deserti]|uniref:Helix-turn-helix domain-containing protein n=1 Tax=Mycobacterium deserti TaxID=2978347 RepID=A0ABT2M7C4_9MYCO|nr:helix-turn-helix domain-containing protein [Mycobacterium deserti]MCT7658159.1 helix-turn-helix domain-containing protein [Mycobacterium deserti]